MSILLLLIFGVPLVWIMIHTAKWSAPVSACLGLAILSIGVTAMKMSLVKYGGGLFTFSAVLFVLGGGMKDR